MITSDTVWPQSIIVDSNVSSCTLSMKKVHSTPNCAHPATRNRDTDCGATHDQRLDVVISSIRHRTSTKSVFDASTNNHTWFVKYSYHAAVVGHCAAAVGVSPATSIRIM